MSNLLNDYIYRQKEEIDRCLTKEKVTLYIYKMCVYLEIDYDYKTFYNCWFQIHKEGGLKKKLLILNYGYIGKF